MKYNPFTTSLSRIKKKLEKRIYQYSVSVLFCFRMPKRPKSNGVKTEAQNDAPPSVRRSKRVKLEVKYEPDEDDIKEEDLEDEDYIKEEEDLEDEKYEPDEVEDLEDEKENLQPKRGASRGSKYSNAKTVLVRGVKSIITDKAMIKNNFIWSSRGVCRFKCLESRL